MLRKNEPPITSVNPKPQDNLDSCSLQSNLQPISQSRMSFYSMAEPYYAGVISAEEAASLGVRDTFSTEISECDF